MISPAELAEKAAALPANPGVYLMKDAQGSVMYVGKAKSLRSRVQSYFQHSASSAPKTRVMVSRVSDIETIVTPTEKDALILENILIKQYRPRYNVIFRDDKEYPYLCLSVQEPYPNLSVVRKPKKDRALYFGPFASSQAVRETLKVINKVFPLRKCHGKKLKKDRPCIYHELGQCPAPCCRSVAPEIYQETVRQVKLFLQGRVKEIVACLEEKMARESDQLNFEGAAQTRDRIAAIQKTMEKQLVVSLDFVDRDVFGYYREESTIVITGLFVRSGRMIGSRSVRISNVRLSDEAILSSSVFQYYDQGEYIPDEVVVGASLHDRAVLAEWLSEKKETVVKIFCPRRGARKELVDMAQNNAAVIFKRKAAQESKTQHVLQELMQRLHLAVHPVHIECYDISSMMGSSAVGSQVVFKNAEPLKNRYRRYAIRTVQGPDDYAMMYEMLKRRLARADDDRLRLPDLMLVDGGKGQLNVLCRALRELNITGVGAASLAKADRFAKDSAGSQEKVYLPGRKNPVNFPKHSAAFLLLQRIRDEAHRYAVAYHKKVKKKKDLTSKLEEIPDIGSATAKALLRHLGSIERIRAASADELSSVPFITQQRARKVYEYFHPTKKQTD